MVAVKWLKSRFWWQIYWAASSLLDVEAENNDRLQYSEGLIVKNIKVNRE